MSEYGVVDIVDVVIKDNKTGKSVNLQLDTNQVKFILDGDFKQPNVELNFLTDEQYELIKGIENE